MLTIAVYILYFPLTKKTENVPAFLLNRVTENRPKLTLPAGFQAFQERRPQDGRRKNVKGWHGGEKLQATPE
jgi:hypothetical protein